MRFVKRHWRALALTAIFAVLGVVIVRFLLAPPSSTPREEDVRRAARIERADPPDPALVVARPEGEWVGGLGIVEPAMPATNLTPTVAGRIAVIHVVEGDRVEPGQVLAELESGPERAEVNVASGDLAQAEARLARVREGARPEEVEALTEELRGARAAAELARTNLARMQRLSRMGAIARQDLDRAEEAARSADADAAAAEARLEAARIGRSEDVREATAAVITARARLERAQAELERRMIRSPIDATVLDIDNRVGEQVEPNDDTPMMVLGDLRTLRVRVEVDERDLGKVRLGAPAVITADTYPGRFFRGSVVQVGELVTQKDVYTEDPRDRLDVKVLEVWVELTDREGIVPGMRVTGYIAEPGARHELVAGGNAPVRVAAAPP